MKKLWLLMGKLVYWVSYPALFVMMYRSKRTRVIVHASGKILAVKGWMGSGHWNLPGGGLHKGEKPADGAVRELAEETGLQVKPESLRHIHTKRVVDTNGIRYAEIFFVVDLPKTVPLQRQKWEISEAAWMPIKELLKDTRTRGRARHLVQVWSEQ